jgi:hypothetical protein
MKYAGDQGDPYLDKNSGVLRNLLGIADQATLDPPAFVWRCVRLGWPIAFG